MLYLDMIMEAGGKREYEFPLAAATKYGIAKGTFERNKKLLIESGFVECVEHNANLRKANRYRFSLAWKQQSGVPP